MNLIAFQKARLEKNKLVIDDGISIDEWKELGQSLKQVEGSVQFWIGDWARFGEKKGFTGKYVSPQVYDELEEITGLDRQTLKDHTWVADSVPSSLRKDDLSFSHHKEVAPLEPEQQEYFLTKASDEKLSVRELREEVKKTHEEKVKDMEVLSDLNQEIETEKELRELAHRINTTYTKHQRIFLISKIKQ